MIKLFFLTELVTHHAAARGVQQHALAGLHVRHLEDEDVGDQVVHGDGGRVQGRHGGGQRVHVLGGHGHQLGPGAVLGQGDHLVTNLNTNDIDY